MLIVSRGDVPKGRSQNTNIPDTKLKKLGSRLAAVLLNFAQRCIYFRAKQRFSCHILGTAEETPVSVVT